MRVIIPAAGEGLRWRHYHQNRTAHEEAGFRKHFAMIGGESIIGRLVRLFRERGVTDIWVVGKDQGYALAGARLFIPEQTPEHYDANKIFNSSELWEGRTVVFYGDVYLTEAGADKVMAETRDWAAFGRWGPHCCTGGPAELFGFTFTEEWFEPNRATLTRIAGMKHRGELPRCAGWEFYWEHNGDARKWEIYDRNWSEIDDLTDDVDTPQQYEDLKRCVGRFS
jgi:hypothetical protein